MADSKSHVNQARKTAPTQETTIVATTVVRAARGWPASQALRRSIPPLRRVSNHRISLLYRYRGMFCPVKSPVEVGYRSMATLDWLIILAYFTSLAGLTW